MVLTPVSIVYKFQLDAPTPKPIMRDTPIVDHPVDCYGLEYHGTMDHKQSMRLLDDTPDGTYLLRRSPGAQDFYTLSLRFANRTRHYRIHHSAESGHYLKLELKHFDTIHDLVADGLLAFYMQAHAAPIIASMLNQTRQSYHQSPYMTLNRRKLRALSGDLRKSLKLGDVTDEPNGVALKKSTLTEETDAGCLNNNGATMTTSVSSQDDDVLPVVYEKPHSFKTHTFKGLNWCEFCANFLWGFTAQGVKCENCSFMAHSKCSELVPAKCVPDLKRIRGVFGTDLTTMVTAHQCVIPFVVRRCVEEVEARGMLQEGIYRVSGFADEIDALKLALDRNGEKTDLSEMAYGNVNVVAGTLKLYLRLLPVPLVTFGAYGAFIRSAGKSVLWVDLATARITLKRLFDRYEIGR